MAESAASSSLCLQEASYVLKTFFLGVTRVPLHEMAVADFNRSGAGVNGKHAQGVIKRIFGQEGLCVWRYNRGMCLEPPPTDPLRYARHTNKFVAMQKSLLAEVELKPLRGSFCKSHLWHGLYTAKVGGRCYHDTGLPIVPNMDDPEVQQTWANGMWFETLQHEAWNKHPNAIKALMHGDNLDAAFALAETEMALISAYFASCRVAVPRPGESFFDAVSRDGPVSGHPDDVKVACFNFAKLLGEEQVEVLQNTFQTYVNASEQVLSAGTLTALTSLPEIAVWCRTSLAVANMCSPSTRMVKHGTKMVGQQVPDGQIRAFAKLDRHAVQCAEEKLAKVVRGYARDHVGSVPSETYLKAQVVFLSKAAEALSKMTGVLDSDERTEDLGQKLGVAEDKMRQILQGATGASLPSRAFVLPAPTEPSPKRQKLSTTADCLPPLLVKEGRVQEDIFTRARAKGLAPGCPVIMGGKSDSTSVQGELLSFVSGSENAQVRDADGTVHCVNLDDLTVDKNALQQKKTKEPRAVDPRQPGRKWSLMTESQAKGAIKDAVRAALFSLNAAWSPGQDQLRVHEETEGETMSINYAAKAGSLVFLPFTSIVSEDGIRPRVLEKQAENAEQDLPLLVVTQKGTKAEPLSLRLYPVDGFYWKFATKPQHQSQDAPTLVFKEVKTQTTVSCSASLIFDKKPLKKSSKITLDLSFQVLTNERDLPAFTVLKAPAAAQLES
ncbi:unnamed protein product [Symbiodinium sp. CCMP2592]|nr:unnamed protein product [Symbiodinium sp. CCMP2592]